MYQITYTKQAVSDIPKIKAAHLEEKVKNLLNVLRENPYQTPPSYEKPVGALKGIYSRRINIQHRLVYLVEEENKQVRILSLWTHYNLL